MCLPFYNCQKRFYERLKDTANSGVKITFVYGKAELNADERKLIIQLGKVSLYYLENLHAKCYYNEKEMVITSMNMYEFSEKNNREMGVFISKKEDEKLYSKAVDETKSIVKAADNIEIDIPDSGYCIRCKTGIDFNIERPYCRSCYNIWSQFENPNNKEKVCHQCGGKEPTTLNEPRCENCDN